MDKFEKQDTTKWEQLTKIILPYEGKISLNFYLLLLSLNCIDCKLFYNLWIAKVANVTTIFLTLIRYTVLKNYSLSHKQCKNTKRVNSGSQT